LVKLTNLFLQSRDQRVYRRCFFRFAARTFSSVDLYTGFLFSVA
jgi:hypothetical protein